MRFISVMTKIGLLDDIDNINKLVREFLTSYAEACEREL